MQRPVWIGVLLAISLSCATPTDTGCSEPSSLTPATGDLRGRALELGPVVARSDFIAGDSAVVPFPEGLQSKTLLVQIRGAAGPVTLTGRRCGGDERLRFEYQTDRSSGPGGRPREGEQVTLELKPQVTTLGDPSWPGYFVYPAPGMYVVEVSAGGKTIARGTIEARPK